MSVRRVQSRNLSFYRGASEQGFTLIEVLVSMLILLVGLLGVAGMQMMSFQANQSAYFRSQAVFLASEMLDNMRANPGGLTSYDGFDSDDAAGIGDPGCASSVGGCSPAQTASEDLRRWGARFVDVFGATNFKPAIPNSRGTIERDGNAYTVEVVWNEREWDNGDAGDGSATRSTVQKTVTLTATLN